MDNKIFEQLTKVQNEIEKLTKVEPVKYIGNGVFTLNSKKFNLHTITQIDVLVNLLSKVIETTKAQKEACGILGIKHVDNYKDVKSDFKKRASAITHREKLNKLYEIEKELEEVLSSKGKRKVAFESLMGELENVLQIS